MYLYRRIYIRSYASLFYKFLQPVFEHPLVSLIALPFLPLYPSALKKTILVLDIGCVCVLRGRRRERKVCKKNKAFPVPLIQGLSPADSRRVRSPVEAVPGAFLPVTPTAGTKGLETNSVRLQKKVKVLASLSPPHSNSLLGT